jgi:hypothetical protein
MAEFPQMDFHLLASPLPHLPADRRIFDMDGANDFLISLEQFST